MIYIPTTIDDTEQNGIIEEKGLNNDLISKEIKFRREICQLSMSGETTHGRCETTLNMPELKPLHTALYLLLKSHVTFTPVCVCVCPSE
mgnify:CR=1 FL=1